MDAVSGVLVTTLSIFWSRMLIVIEMRSIRYILTFPPFAQPGARRAYAGLGVGGVR